MPLPNILNLDKSRKDREFKEYQDSADKLTALIQAEAVKYGWSVKQLQHFSSTILPEVLSISVNNFLVKTKLEDILK